MRNWQVYHVKKPTFGFGEGEANFESDYELVCTVHAPKLSDAFKLTQHLDDKKWWENASVDLIKESRSTSVGDIIVNDKSVKFLALPIGWYIVSDEADTVPCWLMDIQTNLHTEK